MKGVDLKKFRGFDPNDLIEELVRLGDDHADKRAAVRVLKLSKATTSEAKRKVAEAMHEADLAEVRYDAFKAFVELKRTEAVNRRVG